MLEVDRLNVRYGKSHVVFDLDLRVERGDLLALLGRNGAGKTTTIMAIVGLLPGATGAIKIGGQDVSRWPSYRRTKGQVAYVPSGARCFPNLTVTENLELTAQPNGGAGWDNGWNHDFDFPWWNDGWDWNPGWDGGGWGGGGWNGGGWF